MRNGKAWSALPGEGSSHTSSNGTKIWVFENLFRSEVRPLIFLRSFLRPLRALRESGEFTRKAREDIAKETLIRFWDISFQSTFLSRRRRRQHKAPGVSPGNRRATKPSCRRQRQPTIIENHARAGSNLWDVERLTTITRLRGLVRLADDSSGSRRRLYALRPLRGLRSWDVLAHSTAS